MKLAPLALLLLAACRQQPDPQSGNQAAALPAASAPAAAPKAFVHEEKTDLIDFHFAWPAEAAAIPQLVAQLKKQLTEARAELVENAEAAARKDKDFREKEGMTFTPFSSSTDYKLAGRSDRLLSLAIEVSSYTGGAHGNYGTRSLLWDLRSAQQVSDPELFAAAANMDRLLTQRWCDALNKAREEKRGEPVGGTDMFAECPKLSEITIIPTDKNKNGRFETLLLVADPYVAGPYVEGSYEIELAVTPELVAALKDDYRASFEAQTQ